MWVKLKNSQKTNNHYVRTFHFLATRTCYLSALPKSHSLKNGQNVQGNQTVNRLFHWSRKCLPPKKIGLKNFKKSPAVSSKSLRPLSNSDHPRAKFFSRPIICQMAILSHSRTLAILVLLLFFLLLLNLFPVKFSKFDGLPDQDNLNLLCVTRQKGFGSYVCILLIKNHQSHKPRL